MVDIYLSPLIFIDHVAARPIVGIPCLHVLLNQALIYHPLDGATWLLNIYIAIGICEATMVLAVHGHESLLFIHRGFEGLSFEDIQFPSGFLRDCLVIASSDSCLLRGRLGTCW